MSQKWTLVTGANGFIGAHLVRELVARGERVKALVRPDANLKQLEGLPRDRVRIAEGDVRFEHRVFAAMNACDRVYHVAAQVSVDERDAQSIRENSVDATVATLEAARRAGIERVVVTSSFFTLGATSAPTPLDEGHAFDVVDPNVYTAGKRAAEERALALSSDKLDVVVVNPGMVVGPGDWRPTATGALLLRYLKTSPTINVPTIPGGLNFVDVKDVVSGHIAAMEKGRGGERYVLGGENLTHKELLTLLFDLTGLAEPGKEWSVGRARFLGLLAELGAKFNGGSPLLTRKLVDNYYGQYVFTLSEKAKQELGYEPSPVRDALARGLRWYIDNGYVSPQEARRVRLELRPA